MGTDEPITLPSSDDAPFSALAFKIMTDPFVGSLTFARVYSGVLEVGHRRAEQHEGPQGAYRPHAADARQQPRRRQGSPRRRHRRPGRPQERHDRRHAVRPGACRDPRADGLPGSRHRARGRAEVEGRPGEARPGAGPSRRRKIRPSACRPTRKPARPSSRAWASSISRSRSTSCAAPTRSRPMSARRRSPIARRIGRKAEIDYTHKKQSGGSGQFARVKLTVRAGRAGCGLLVREQDRRRLDPQGVHPGRREGPRGLARDRRARRLPGDRLQGHADRRQLP